MLQLIANGTPPMRLGSKARYMQAWIAKQKLHATTLAHAVAIAIRQGLVK